MAGLLIGLLVAVAVLAGADYAVWRYAEQQLLLGYVTWIAGARAAGWSVSAGEPVRSGWPMRARLDVSGVFIAGGQGLLPGGLAWSGDRLGLEVGLLHPHTLRLIPGGVQRLRLATLPDVAYSAGAAMLDLPLAGSHDEPVLAVSHLHVDLPAGALTVDAATLGIGLPSGAASGLTARLRAGGIGLPGGVTWPFGPVIASLTLDAALAGGWPTVAPGPDGTIAPAAWLAAWRDGGGRLLVPALLLQWGPLGLSASASMTLDARLRPAGSGTARLSGAPAALDAFAASGLIGAQQAVAAKAVLGLMTRPATAAGSQAELDLPLTASDGLLSVGQIPVLRLPAIAGPG